MTLRSRHLSALSSTIASHRDMRAIFEDKTLQASIVHETDQKKRYVFHSTFFLPGLRSAYSSTVLQPFLERTTHMRV